MASKLPPDFQHLVLLHFFQHFSLLLFSALDHSPLSVSVMLLLEPANKIIADTLQLRFEKYVRSFASFPFYMLSYGCFSINEKPDVLDLQLVDFDGVTYHFWTPIAENRNILRLSMNMKCYSQDLVAYGAQAVMQREYSQLLQDQPETGYDVTLDFDETQIPAAERGLFNIFPSSLYLLWLDAFIRRVSLLKANAMAAPFERAFDDQLAGQSSADYMVIHYREDETIFIKSAADRVTVIFSTLFKEETDKILAKVFLQEFVDCRRQPALQNAPQALYTNRDPPMELRGVKGLKTGDQVGYVTFVLFPRHFQTPTTRVATIHLIQGFRDYLHYHIKCSKAYLHSRMRAKVESWLKVCFKSKMLFYLLSRS